MAIGYKKEAKTLRAGYKIVKSDYGVEKEVCWALPKDDVIKNLSYDFTLLDRAIRYKRSRGLDYYPDIETILNLDENWEYQCRVWEQVVEWGLDYDKANATPSD